MSRRPERAPGLALRADELFERVLAPLVLGGPIRPVRPLGPRLTLALLDGHEPADGELASRVELSRVRRARTLCPIDVLPPPSGAEWALVAVMSDLVQAANPELSGAFGASRPARLLRLAEGTLSRIPAPRTVGDALARHATFARLLAVTRLDSVVSWWTGHETFVGRTPPARLLAWPELRRVEVARAEVPFASLAERCPKLDPVAHRRAVALLVAASPLTDLADAARAEPRFTFTAASLALLSTDAGLALALRAVDRGGPPDAMLSALTQTAALAPFPDPVQRRIALLVEALRARREALNPFAFELARTWATPMQRPSTSHLDGS